METQSILHIVSGFKPSVDGMGDFSRLLGAALWRQHAIGSHFLVYKRAKSQDEAQTVAEEIAPNTLSYAAEATPAAFLQEFVELQRTHSFACVLLHYGPYAYSGDGRPAAFTEAMREIASSVRVLVFFHETYSMGWPWKRSFWTKREQMQSVRSLLQIASIGFTSNVKYRGLLEPLNDSHRELIQIPIFSNVGEPEHVLPLAQRERQLVIFGQLVTRVRLYKDRLLILEDICRRLRIAKIVDVGSGKSEHIPDSIAGAPLRRSGWMDEAQLSELMSNSIAGVVGYWPDVWEKSGVIAAYSAHGLVPILEQFEKRSMPEPPFVPYVSVQRLVELSSADGVVSDISLQGIADAARGYYMEKQSVNRCAETIARYAIHR